jgi:hypothetical protein
MNEFALSCEIAYRQEQLHRIAAVHRSKRSARLPRWRSLSRKPTTASGASAPLASSTAAAHVVGTQEVRDWVTEVDRAA